MSRADDSSVRPHRTDNARRCCARHTPIADESKRRGRGRGGGIRFAAVALVSCGTWVTCGKMANGTTRAAGGEQAVKMNGQAAKSCVVYRVCSSHYTDISTHKNPAQPVSVLMPPRETSWSQTTRRRYTLQMQQVGSAVHCQPQ